MSSVGIVHCSVLNVVAPSTQVKTWPGNATTAMCWKQSCVKRANGRSDTSATVFYRSSESYYFEMLFNVSKIEASVSTCLLNAFY